MSFGLDLDTVYEIVALGPCGWSMVLLAKQDMQGRKRE